MNRTIKHSTDGNPWFPIVGLGSFSLVTLLGLQSFNIDKRLTSAPLLEVSLEGDEIVDPGFIHEAYMREGVGKERSPALYDWYIYMFNQHNPDSGGSTSFVFPDLDRNGYVFGKKGKELHYAQRQ